MRRNSLFTKAILVLAMVLMLELLVWGGAVYMRKQGALASPENDAMVKVTFRYVEPTEILKNDGTELAHRSKLDIKEGHSLKVG